MKIFEVVEAIGAGIKPGIGLGRFKVIGVDSIAKQSDKIVMYMASAEAAEAYHTNILSKISKDDIAEALNHVDGEHRTTDIYIEKDWSIVDDVQAAVINFIRSLDSPQPEVTATAPLGELANPDAQRKTMRLVSA